VDIVTGDTLVLDEAVALVIEVRVLVAVGLLVVAELVM